MVAGRNDAGSRIEHRSDLRYALGGDRRHGDDRLSALRQRSAVDEIDLTAHARPELRTDRIGADLTRQVDLDGRVDGHEAVVLRNDVGIVRISHVHHQHTGVVVDEVVDLLRTHQERRDHLARIGFLGLAVDNALAYERQHAVGEHLGMDTQVLMVAQLRQHGVGNGSDAHLQRRAVLDQFGAVRADSLLHVARFGELRLDERLVVLHEQVDLRQGNHRLTEGTGNVLVHHGDHMVGAFDSRQRSVDRRSQRNVAVLVRRADLNHRHVAGHRTRPVQLLRFAQKDRNVIGVAALRHLPDIRADEERIELEDTLELRVGIGRRPFGVQMVHVDVLQLAGLAAGAHGLDEALRGRSHRTQMDMIARLDDLHGLLGRCEFDRSIHYCLFKFEIRYLNNRYYLRFTSTCSYPSTISPTRISLNDSIFRPQSCPVVTSLTSSLKRLSDPSLPV